MNSLTRNNIIQMQKIYRRKNQQITKDFVCLEGCGKAYGSYAALYTHMKNKHGFMKTLDIKSTSQMKTKASGKKGRPLIKVKVQNNSSEEQINENACRICYEESCICDSSINQSDVEKNLALFTDKLYIRFLNCVSQLNIGQQFTWIRSSEEDFDFFSKERLNQVIEQFNTKNTFLRELHLSERWLEYISHISQYLDRKYINELFDGIFTIICKRNQEFSDLIPEGQQFPHLKRCCLQKKKEWKQFIQTVLMI